MFCIMNYNKSLEEHYYTNITYDKIYIREYKDDFVTIGFISKLLRVNKELCISTLWVKGGHSKITAFFKIKDVSQVIKNPITPLVQESLKNNNVLLRSRITQNETIKSKIYGKKIMLKDFMKKYPEYFV